MNDNHPLTNRARKIAELQAERLALQQGPPKVSFSDTSPAFARLLKEQTANLMPKYIKTRLALIDTEIQQQKRELIAELEATA